MGHSMFQSSAGSWKVPDVEWVGGSGDSGQGDRCAGPRSPRAETTKYLVELQCRRIAKLSSGVVLHKVLPTCSFFCMYNRLFIKGFEVLSQ